MNRNYSKNNWPGNEILRVNPAFLDDSGQEVKNTDEKPPDSQRPSITPDRSDSSSQNDQISNLFYETKDPTWVQYGQKLLKLFVTIVCGFIIASSASFSVLGFLLAIKGVGISGKNVTIASTTLGNILQMCSVKSYTMAEGKTVNGPLNTDSVIDDGTLFDLTLQYNVDASTPWYWAIAFMMMSPEVLGFIVSMQLSWSSKDKTKQTRLGPLKHIAITIFVEGMQMLLVGLLAFVVFPNYCSVSTLMLLNCTAAAPALVKMLFNIKLAKKAFPICVSVFVLIGQLMCPLGAFGPWSISNSLLMTILLTSCLILLSITYWTNFFPPHPNLPYWFDQIFRFYRRNGRRAKVQTILCLGKIVWTVPILFIGSLASGNVANLADLFRFSTWSGTSLTIQGYGQQVTNASIMCNPKFDFNFTTGNCSTQCGSLCQGFGKPCFTADHNECVQYCYLACQPCKPLPTSTTQITTSQTVTTTVVSSVSNVYMTRANSKRPTTTVLPPAVLSCGLETLQTVGCQQTCSIDNHSQLYAFLSLSAQCDIYNPPTAGRNVISTVWLTLLMQIGCSWLCYSTAVLACKVGVQKVAFSFSLVIATPLITIVCAIYFTFIGNQLTTFDFFPTLLFKADSTTFIGDPWSPMFGLGIFAMFIWYLSFIVVTSHVWQPSEERLANVWRLFSQPTFWSIAIDKSLLLSRRHLFDYESVESKEKSKTPDPMDSILGSHVSSSVKELVQLDDESYLAYPKIYVCGTLWHEEPEEMKSLLTSILRLNHDQTLRQLIHDPEFRKDYIDILKDIEEKDYYELEFDLVFDDGFMPYKEDENTKGRPDSLIMNTYVRKWCEVVAETLTEVNGNHKGTKPKKYNTPYGGRLEWKLEGGNILNVHLKNKQEVRHKKRWSQVMYMFYILDYKMKKEFGQDARELEHRLHNTYLLTLDGDVDFQPIAVTRLVDLMKKNDQIGSVCGRIHPLGSGPMIWYQKFEYAVGHWFQKAAEHVFGCVLCSPGCFALFRGSAVVQNMGTYAQVSESAMDYLQHDQGEDRWLCTLLLQNGWRIEYCAASDAKTYAPEELSVFFGQRKRWTPSTLANQMDLLNSSTVVIEKNTSMTFGFMIYQTFMVVCTVIGSGSIFLMLFGSLATIFDINDTLSIFINLIVVIFYSLVCYYCNEKTQLRVTEFLALIYGLIMIAVLVAICIQGVQEGPTSPNTLFLIIMVLCFLIGGLLHPQEVLCLPPGIIYFAAIPCTYMLLNIYTVCNCHKVNWGTRELPNANAKLEQLKHQEEQTSKVQSTVFKYADYMGTFCAKLCCRKDKKVEENAMVKILEDRMKVLEKQIVELQDQHLTTNSEIQIKETKVQLEKPQDQKRAPLQRTKSILKTDNTEDTPTEWLFGVHKGRCFKLPSEEEEFWRDFVDTKLFTLIQDKKKEKVMQDELLALRSKAMTAFYLLNAFYILIIYLLQLYQDMLSFDWPFSPCSWNYGANKLLVTECGLNDAVHYVGQCCNNCNNATAPYTPIDANSTLADCRNDYLVKQLCTCLQVEPVTIVVIVFFLLLLLVQFIGLIFHRLETGMHVVSTTYLKDQDHDKITLPELLDVVEYLENVDNDVTFVTGDVTLVTQPEPKRGLMRRNTILKRLARLSENAELPPESNNDVTQIRENDNGNNHVTPYPSQKTKGLYRQKSQYAIFKEQLLTKTKDSTSGNIQRNLPGSNLRADGQSVRKLKRAYQGNRGQYNNQEDDDLVDDVFSEENVQKTYFKQPYGSVSKGRRPPQSAINVLLNNRLSTR